MCDDKYSDLRPVTGWVRTRRWRTGLNIAFSSSDRSVKPSDAAGEQKRVFADQLLDLGLGGVVERIVGGAHVGEFGAPAVGCGDAAGEDGIFRRHRPERTVGVPEAIAQVEHAAAVVAGEGLVVGDRGWTRRP